MKNYTLHYEPIWQGKYTEYKFDNLSDIGLFVDKLIRKHPIEKDADIVFVACIEDEVFITQSRNLVIDLFSGKVDEAHPGMDIHGRSILCECETCAQAYELALSLKKHGKYHLL